MRKIALSNNDNKILLDYNGINRYAHGTTLGTIAKNKLSKERKETYKKLTKVYKQHTKMFNLDDITIKNDNKT